MHTCAHLHLAVCTPQPSLRGWGGEGSDADQSVGVCERHRNACNWKKLCVNNLYHFALHCGPSEMHARVLSKAVLR